MIVDEPMFDLDEYVKPKIHQSCPTCASDNTFHNGTVHSTGAMCHSSWHGPKGYGGSKNCKTITPRDLAVATAKAMALPYA